MDISKGCSLAMIVTSCISAVGSLTMLADQFSDNRHSIYSHIILCISISCLFNATGTMMGEPKDGSAECWFMGIDTNIFSLSAMFWTAYLTYTLHCISRASDVMHVPSSSSLIRIHIVCWGVPIAVTLLPLTSFTYGSPENYGWCFLVDRGRQEPMLLFFWILMAYYIWVWASLTFSLYYLIAAERVMDRNCQSQRSVRAAKKALFRLRLFCSVILISWLPNTVLEIVVFFLPSMPKGEYVLPIRCFAASMASLQGAFTAAVYWFTSGSMRRALSSRKINVHNASEKGNRPRGFSDDSSLYSTDLTANRRRGASEDVTTLSSCREPASVKQVYVMETCSIKEDRTAAWAMA